MTIGPADVGGKVTIDTGKGDDDVIIDGLTMMPTNSQEVSIKTIDGDDTVHLKNSILHGKLTIDTGKGDDTVLIDPTTVDNDVSIKTGR